MSIYDEKYDVVVAGGGPAGVAAAIAAARNNAKVLLLERYGFFGGMLTNASLPVFCPFSDGEKPVVGGIGLEILTKMQEQAWNNPFIEKNNGIKELDWVAVDPEVLKRVIDELLVQSGCTMLLHTAVIGVNMNAQNMESVVVSNKEGLNTVKAKYFIDCTGDADITALAGGYTEYGDENGLVQGVTLCFRISNVDGKKFLEYKLQNNETGNLNRAVEKAKKEGKFPFSEKQVATFALQDWATAGLNFGHIFGINPLKAKDLTRAEMESRQALPKLLEFLKSYVPGLENAVLASSGPFIGIRESRRIIGEYRLTKKDYFLRNSFEDNIARYSYPIDIHASSPSEVVTDDNMDEFINSRYQTGESYGIPYRALLPVKLKNLLVAGRTISTDRAMHGSCRVTPACFATGQAAGTATAICCTDNCELRAVDIRKLQDCLTKQGAII